jgi:hypothetical protein
MEDSSSSELCKRDDNGGVVNRGCLQLPIPIVRQRQPEVEDLGFNRGWLRVCRDPKGRRGILDGLSSTAGVVGDTPGDQSAVR